MTTTLEKAIQEIIHKDGLGHGQNCYCHEVAEIFTKHKDLKKLIHESDLVTETMIMMVLIQNPSKALAALSIAMIEVGIRIGLRMSTPEINEDILL